MHTHVCTVCNATLMSQTHFHLIVMFVMHMIVFFARIRDAEIKSMVQFLLELNALEPYIVNAQSVKYNIELS